MVRNLVVGGAVVNVVEVFVIVLGNDSKSVVRAVDGLVDAVLFEEEFVEGRLSSKSSAVDSRFPLIKYKTRPIDTTAMIPPRIKFAVNIWHRVHVFLDICVVLLLGCLLVPISSDAVAWI